MRARRPSRCKRCGGAGYLSASKTFPPAVSGTTASRSLAVTAPDSPMSWCWPPSEPDGRTGRPASLLPGWGSCPPIRVGSRTISYPTVPSRPNAADGDVRRGGNGRSDTCRAGPARRCRRIRVQRAALRWVTSGESEHQPGLGWRLARWGKRHLIFAATAGIFDAPESGFQGWSIGEVSFVAAVHHPCPRPLSRTPRYPNACMRPAL